MASVDYERKALGSRSISKDSNLEIRYGITAFRREQWDWISYRHDLWEGGASKIFSDRENYGIWCYSCPEMAIFPALVAWLKQVGTVVIASPDGFLDEAYQAAPGFWLDIEEIDPETIPDMHDLLYAAEIHTSTDPGLADVTFFQGVRLSDRNVDVDFYVIDGALPERLVCHASEASYWSAGINSCSIFGTYIIPLETDAENMFVFFGSNAGLIDSACNFILGALREIQEIRDGFLEKDDPSGFLDAIERFVREFPGSWQDGADSSARANLP